jgi:hypothetical protein
MPSGSRDDEDGDRPRSPARRRAAVRDYDDDDRRPARRGSTYSSRPEPRRDLVRVTPVRDYDDEDDDVEDPAKAYARAGFASVAWFSVPLAGFLLWAVFLGGTARADCVDANGRPCPAPREAAFATFTEHLPQVGVAVVLSIVVALAIRLMAPLWRPATIGFAAAVVGAGVSTVVFTVLNGGSI